MICPYDGARIAAAGSTRAATGVCPVCHIRWGLPLEERLAIQERRGR